MLSESRKKKLDMLIKSLAQGDLAKANELLRQHGHSGINRPGSLSRQLPQNNSPASTPQAVGFISLCDACPGTETSACIDQHDMKYWAIYKTLQQVDPENIAIAAQYAAVMNGARQRVDELKASVALCHASVAKPDDLLFMDIESCGLYGASLFLIGMMYFHEGTLHFEQCLARTYAEEAAVLAAFWRRLEKALVLVTFNGRSFDMNMIRDRSVFHRLEMPRIPLPHLDLLHESRRRWKGSLPNCRLQTLEEHLFGRKRYGDIPGWAIPDAYHRFVDNGDARQVCDILHHNLLDLLTMAELLTVVLSGEDPVEGQRQL